MIILKRFLLIFAIALLFSKISNDKVYSNDFKTKFSDDISLVTIEHTGDLGSIYGDINSKTDLAQNLNLAQEPSAPGRIISVTRITPESFMVNIEKGNGERRILLMSEEKPCELPKDGNDYTGELFFGNGDKIGEHTYVISNQAESQQKRFLVTNLKPGTRYYMLLCEANGSGEKINYLIPDTSKFTAYKSTLPLTPKLEEAFDIKKGSFKLKWNKVKGALSYFLDVAKDRSFKDILQDYKEMDLGDINEYLIEGIEGQNKVYCRIRAVGESGQSGDSNIIEVSF
ncbi:MAG: hypothetical protein N2319_11805 [Candidatus Kapabacteria bacterium]|nr:hypothetical protein [Candidatus Kapabacteria bacterium]